MLKLSSIKGKVLIFALLFISIFKGYAYSSTAIVCYFGNDGLWEWGLNSDNSWATLDGEWATGALTKIQRFKLSFDSSNPNAINELYVRMATYCANSAAYYNVDTNIYPLRAFFAAVSNTGSNYPFLLGENVLFGKY